MVFDYKKEYKNLYIAKNVPEIYRNYLSCSKR